MFTNKEIPDFCRISVDGEALQYPERYPLEKGHGAWWDKCFSDIPQNLPRFHYGFAFDTYTEIQKDICSKKDPNWFSHILGYDRIAKEYVRHLITVLGDEPLYVVLHTGHVITEEDIDSALEFNLDDYDFHEGYAPKELWFEINRFYRLTVR